MLKINLRNSTKIRHALSRLAVLLLLVLATPNLIFAETTEQSIAKSFELALVEASVFKNRSNDELAETAKKLIVLAENNQNNLQSPKAMLTAYEIFNYLYKDRSVQSYLDEAQAILKVIEFRYPLFATSKDCQGSDAKKECQAKDSKILVVKAKPANEITSAKQMNNQGKLRTVISFSSYPKIEQSLKEQDDKSYKLTLSLKDTKLGPSLAKNSDLKAISNLKFAQAKNDGVLEFVLPSKDFQLLNLENAGKFTLVLDSQIEQAPVITAKAELELDKANKELAESKTATMAVASKPDKQSTKTALEPKTNTKKEVAAVSATPKAIIEKSTLSKALGLKIRRIVVDPGHGGKDPGAVAGGKYEKDMTLHLAKLVKNNLIANDPELEVILTRDKDEYLSLEQRSEIANNLKADLFISIHINAHTNNKIEGFETYYLNYSNEAGALNVAARENTSSALTLSQMDSILKLLVGNTKLKESEQFAKHVHSAVFQDLDKEKLFSKDLGVKQAPFLVLLGAKMPSLLLEVGFITNGQERSRLDSSVYSEKIATSISDGIMSYIKWNSGGADFANK